MPGCPCGKCDGIDRSSPSLQVVFQSLSLRFPGLISASGTRCPEHNKEVGGSETSGHLAIWGKANTESVAYDLHLSNWNKVLAMHLAWEAVKAGAMGIEIDYDDRHVHIDLKPRIRWWKIVASKESVFFEK